VIEARDLIVADLRGTSDPYVRVNLISQILITFIFFNPSILKNILMFLSIKKSQSDFGVIGMFFFYGK